MSEIAAWFHFLLLTVLQLYRLPLPLPPPVSNSSCLFTRCQPCVPAIVLYYLLYFLRYCTVRLKMFSLFSVCFLCIIMHKDMTKNVWFLYIIFMKSNINLLQYTIHLPMQEMQVWSLRWKDRLEKEKATHSSILTWEIPWTEESSRLHSKESTKHVRSCTYHVYNWIALLNSRN